MNDPIWQAGRFQLNLHHPIVMGIVNVTPDSFSDGGLHGDTWSAMAHCEKLLKEGAQILDIGGESSRPGAPELSAAEEWSRIGSLVRDAIGLRVPISVDTYKPETMAKALDLGADIINDIRALQEPEAVDVVSQHPSCGVCLMHMQGKPDSMQVAPSYEDPVLEVKYFLEDRAQALIAKGVAKSRITLDPGYGFGKTPEHNLSLLQRQREILELGYPLLIGWSRKSTIGVITGRPVEQRLAGSLAAALASIQNGARVIRVHDVAETVDVIKVWTAAGLVDESFI
ncbi:MAG: dihydropteroate synthase [Aquabacterium sp.]|jgi:dihydropteroate synthase|nr:dihydropteroate synthase [Aquabacterium sp.]MCC7545137.1 dihydropteroate synthase [Aquabacterium sp.]